MRDQLFYLTFLFLSVFSIGGDMYLTDIALENDFYETNELTNKIGTFNHALLLFGSIIIISSFMFIYINPKVSISFLWVFNIIWGLNNIYSSYLLRGVL